MEYTSIQMDSNINHHLSNSFSKNLMKLRQFFDKTPGNAIFQVVYPAYSTTSKQLCLSWPENSRGYVQFGSLSIY